MSAIGQGVSAYLKAGVKDRYFYGLRRTDEGELYIGKVDQMLTGDGVSVNVPGDPAKNFSEFDQGQDFYEGRGPNHDKVFANLKYEQFRWDDVNLNYYVNSEGELVVRINSQQTDGTVAYPNTDEQVVYDKTIFSFDRDVYYFVSNELTFDKH